MRPAVELLPHPIAPMPAQAPCLTPSCALSMSAAVASRGRASSSCPAANLHKHAAQQQYCKKRQKYSTAAQGRIVSVCALSPGGGCDWQIFTPLKLCMSPSCSPLLAFARRTFSHNKHPPASNVMTPNQPRDKPTNRGPPRPHT